MLPVSGVLLKKGSEAELLLHFFGEVNYGASDLVMVHGCFDGFPCAVVFPCDLFDGFSCEELFSEVVAELCMVAPYHQGASAAVRMTGSRVCSFAVR